MMPNARSIALTLVLATAACKPDAASAPTPGSTASAPAPAPSSAAPATAARARKVKESSGLYEFDYSYPAAAGAIPPLRDWLDADLAKGRAELAKSAREGRAEAKAGSYSYNAYAQGTEWQVVADLPDWLSLSAQVYDYSGGAHPNHGYTAMLWDKRANRRLAPLDLFTGKAALSAAIRERFCDLLDKERARRRGEPVDRAGGGMFDACIDPAGSTVILGSSNHRTFDRIGVLVGPYEAGPYAEGDYDITLPVTGAVIAAVKPEYRAAFAASR